MLSILGDVCLDEVLEAICRLAVVLLGELRPEAREPLRDIRVHL